VDTLDPSFTEPGDTWTCTARTFDGEFFSAASVPAVVGPILALGAPILTLNAAPETIIIGQSVTLSGSIAPVVGTVGLDFGNTDPAGSSSKKPVNFNSQADSTFSAAFLPDAAGAWSFEAGWAGDVTYLGDSDGAGLIVLKAQPT
jgi:hypothetical protein